MNLRILTADEARAAGCGETDSRTFNLSADNAKIGKPGFWSRHSYHQALLTTAATIANDESLEAACVHVATGAMDRRWSAVEWVGRFLDRLYPANAIARGELIMARASWCATFSEVA